MVCLWFWVFGVRCVWVGCYGFARVLRFPGRLTLCVGII